jgi:hypothetical protein
MKKQSGLRAIALMLLPFMFSKEMRDVARGGKPNYGIGKWQQIPFYAPKKTKFKGWMREKRRCTFNKNK